MKEKNKAVIFIIVIFIFILSLSAWQAGRDDRKKENQEIEKKTIINNNKLK